ncbi:IDEAL domain-containing protein [Sporolactobacillus sp. CPB3-1]|uniref:IDEAL domain-containing protein n=1 Tax=Sporolactobacillus mangiferae TaxID=2940498 RepID=A0ABT0MA89_9BACL|nr:IDEAL domain-containing protein [Sporolactobacillus mangiferae]MCL1631786.1 IDEAL domain-containing protein [Sporolactobacillus mangiferae]
MNNEHSSQENSKALVVYQEQQAKVSVVEMYAQMILDEMEFNQKVKSLRQRIDASLDSRNKALFMKLTAEYKALTR